MKTQSHNFKSVQYQGSKAKLLTFLEESLAHYFDSIGQKQELKTFFDAFSGSGQVAHHFKDKFDLITNDKQSFTKVINDTYLSSNAHVERIQELVDELNNLSELYFYQTDGWFTKTYSQDFLDGSAVSQDGSRKLWLTKNGRKVDMIRTRIDEMRDSGEITQDEMNILLTSLLRAANLVQNTMGHQNSYLKEWSDKALKDLVLLVPEFQQCKRNHKNLCGEIGDVIDEVHADITYFDPPYGSNNKSGSGFSYSAYYHLNNTIVENSRPETFGKASRPLATKGNKDTIEKNKKELVFPEFVNLVQRSKSKFVCFSYSTQGLLSTQDFEEVFRLGGCDMSTFKVYYTSHKKNKQSQTALKNGVSINRDNHDEELYELFIIAKKKPVRLVECKLEQKIETYLEESDSSHSISDKSYSIYYDNKKGSFIENTTGEISMTSNEFYFEKETSPETIALYRSRYVLQRDNKLQSSNAVQSCAKELYNIAFEHYGKENTEYLVSICCAKNHKQIGFYIVQHPKLLSDSAIITLMFVKPKYQGKGYEKALLDHFESQHYRFKFVSATQQELWSYYVHFGYIATIEGLLNNGLVLCKPKDIPAFQFLTSFSNAA
ncbi:DNA adenine methylase [Vibrio parahaemolyticus]